MPRRIVAIVGLAVVVALVILWGVLAGRGGTEVDAVRVTRGPLEVTLPVTGVLETRAAELAFELPGRLADVRVREGDAVRAGQTLAALDSAELEAAADQAAAGADAARGEAGRGAGGGRRPGRRRRSRPRASRPPRRRPRRASRART